MTVPTGTLFIFILCVNITLGNSNETKKYILNSSNTKIIISDTVVNGRDLLFQIAVDLPEGAAIKLSTESSGATEEIPLLVFIHQESFSTLKQVPAINSGNATKVSRTLCPRTLDNSLNVTFATYSYASLGFTAVIQLEQYQLKTNEKISNLVVSKTDPQVLFYKFDNRSSEVLVRIESSGAPLCALVAIHPAGHCPFTISQGSESDLKTGKIVDYQTMLNKAIMIINIDETPAYGEHGFNIFIIGAQDDEECNKSIDRSFPVTAKIDIVIETFDDMRVISTVLTLALYVLSGLLGVCLLSVSSKYKIELVGRFDEVEGGLNTMMQAQSQTDSSSTASRQYDISIVGIGKNPTKKRAPNVPSELSVTELPAVANDKLYRTQRMQEHSLEDRSSNHLKTKSSQYSWLILTVGIYYTLPVVQLVLLYQSMATLDGNRDICYFNYECQYPWGIIQDYGNVFSNIGYAFLGIFFSAIVAFRRRRYQLYKQNVVVGANRKYGIPEQFGIFVALGLALTLEGILSAAYHICPTKRSFQFDTTFMFFISILLFLKIYQFRHPNVIQTARTIFLLLATALIFETLGYYAHSWFYMVAFIAVYVTILICFLSHLYWDGLNPGVIKTFQRFLHACSHLVKHPEEFKQISWPFVTLALVNAAVAFLIILFGRPEDVSGSLLGIFMVNMTLYLFYYIGMKMFYCIVKKESNEQIRLISWLYLLMACAFAFPSLYFFTAQERTSSVSPAESRQLNQPCTIGIYDKHDLWHFLSASGLFYLFLFILTIEDGNMEMQRKLIRIF